MVTLGIETSCDETSVAVVEETATVGVFRDLREELRIDAELQQTRERLAVAEKAALVSELAGALAHELNQPLTSVLGYSELLFRRTRENEKGREELSAILREAERMAAIVKKIGKITTAGAITSASRKPTVGWAMKVTMAVVRKAATM